MAQTKTNPIDLTDNNTYTWTESLTKAGEFHLELLAGGDPLLAAEPDSITQAGVTIAAGTVGSLANTWDWADNDTLGYSTVYVNLTGDLDPDTLHGTTNELVGFVTTSVTAYGASPMVPEGKLNFKATGSGAMSETITVEEHTKIKSITLHLSSVGATAEDFVVAIDSDTGTAYDAVLLSQDMDTVTDFFSNTEINLAAGSDLDFTYANTDASTWGLEVVFGDA